MFTMSPSAITVVSGMPWQIDLVQAVSSSSDPR